MDTYFYIVTISLFIVFTLGGIYIKKKVSSRAFVFDYAIEEQGFKLSWKTFSLPVFLFLIAFINWIDVGFLILSTLVLLAILFDILQSKNPRHKSYLISDTKLIYNGWRVKQFDLKDLESIRFLPFRNSFKFIFKNNKSIVIPRILFDRNLLSNFIQRALQLSTENIDIEEDAKTKIYI